MPERDQSQPQREENEVPPIASPLGAYGNRPASSGQTVDTTSHTQQEWRGSEGASDFLGLSQEISGTPSGDPGVAAESADPGATATEGTGPSSSWLMSLDDPNRARAGSAAAGETTDEADETGAAGEGWTDEEQPKRSGRRPLLLAAAAVVLAAGAYVLIDGGRIPFVGREPAPELVQNPAGGTPRAQRPRVAQTDPTSTSATPPRVETDPSPTTEPNAMNPDPTASAPTNPVATQPTEVVATSSATEPGTASNPTALTEPDVAPTTSPLALDPVSGSRLGNARFTAWLRSRGWTQSPDPVALPGDDGREPSWLAGAETGGSAQLARVPILPYALGAAPAMKPAYGPPRSGTANPNAANPGEALASTGFATASARVVMAKPSAASGLRVATAEDLAGIWEGNTVPMDSIGSTTRILTPGVGLVRVILKGGEIFEGRLYAVGEGQLWLETDLGRMALFGYRVGKVEQLLAQDGTPGKGTSGAPDLANLPRMRVRMPGGVFYGRIVARDERSVTLVTDSGARVTLDSTDVEPAPVNETRIVGPVKP